MVSYIKHLGLKFVVLLLLAVLGLAMGFTTGVMTGPVHAKSDVGPTPTATLPPVSANPVPMQQMQPVNVTALQVAAAGANCGLVVPANPFSGIGLATPWQLFNGALACHEHDAATAVFLQATIFDPATKQFFIYPPLVVDVGTLPVVAPPVPALPADAVVGIWGGSNGGAVKLVGDGAGQCINGTPQPFGQVFFCNAQAFFAAVTASGVRLPPLGIGNDGQPCPTVRDFSIVDQDQSDNVQTEYLVDATGRTAQNTANNRALLDQVGTIVVGNPSDNRVLTNYVDKALGCSPMTAPDIADGGAPEFSQALDEIQAAMYQAPPQAYIPAGDPMALTAGLPDLAKVNEYRTGAGQPLATTLADASTAVYCVNILNAAPAKLLLDKAAFLSTQSPVPTQGDSLYTFMASRLSVTLGPAADGGLGCTTLLGIVNPVQLTLNANGTAVEATVYGK